MFWVGITVLCAKACYCSDKVNPSRDKYTAKGVQKFRNPLQKEDYNDVLYLERLKMVQNVGFQLQKNIVKTYVLDKRGFTNLYVKHMVADDKVTSAPLDI